MSPEDLRFLEFGRFRFDVRNRRLTREGQLIPLTPKAADLLLALLNGRGDVVSKDDLLRTVWPDTFVEEGNLAFHIHAIREALREETSGHPYVENVPRRGYRFAVPIRESNGDGPDQEAATAFVVEVPAQPVTRPAEPAWRGRRMLLRALATMMIVTVVVAVGGAVALQWSQPKHLRVVRYQQITTDRREKDLDRPLLTDGSNVYFRQAVQSSISLVPASGGETSTVMDALRDFLILDINLRRGEFLVMRRNETDFLGQLWAASRSGSLRRVGTIVCMSAAWSPDGGWIAYTTDSDLHVARADGTESKRLAVFEGTVDWPRWSPDGRTLRFTLNTVVDRETTQKIWEIAADGTGLRPLPIGTALSRDCCGTWTPDGEHFVFESKREGRSQLWAIPERKRLLGREGFGPQPLTAGPLSFAMPGMSADGTRLFALGSADHGELVRFDKTLRTFAPYLDGISAIWVAFSHDGQSVVYVRYPEATLWRARSDGSQPRQLTSAPMQADGCAWSPDGKWIAFRGRVPGRPFKIFLIRADGGQPTPLIEEDREQGIPTWNAESTRLVFGGVPSRYGAGSGETIQIYDVTSRQFSTVPGSENLWTPRWSPDGRYISAVTIATRSLRLFDVTTGSWRAINADHVDNSTWSKDSESIYYHTEGRVRALRRVRLPSGTVEEVVNLEGFPIRAYWWSGLSLDDSPLVLRHLGAPEIYALDLERR